jgi:hypothetical protein
MIRKSTPDYGSPVYDSRCVLRRWSCLQETGSRGRDVYVHSTNDVFVEQNVVHESEKVSLLPHSEN